MVTFDSGLFAIGKIKHALALTADKQKAATPKPGGINMAYLRKKKPSGKFS